MRYLFWIVLFLTAALTVQTQPVPIGAWQEHLPWNQAINVASTESGILCRTQFGIFRVNHSDNSIDRFHKINGLHGSEISAIGYQKNNGKILVAYTDAGVDILSSNSIIHLPEIRINNINADKKIRHIFSDDQYAYLSTGFGIVLINTAKNEIADTWFPGNNGNFLQINQVHIFGNRIYAATEFGLLSTPKEGSNPADFHNWSKEQNGLPDTAISGLEIFQDHLIATVGNHLYRFVNNVWELWYTSHSTITAQRGNPNRFAIINNSEEVFILNSSAQVEKVIQLPSGSKPAGIEWSADEWWIADSRNGLLRISNSFGVEAIVPNGPRDITLGRILADASGVYCAPGTGRASAISYLKEGKWSTIDKFPSTFENINSISRTNGYIYASSSGDGLARIDPNNNVAILKDDIGLSPVLNQPGQFRINALHTDRDGNLWIANDGAVSSLAVLNKEGRLTNFTPSFPNATASISGITSDHLGQIWFISPQNNGVVCLNYGKKIDNKSDDQWRFFGYGRGLGNLPDPEINCITTDRNGFVWVGTDKGIGVMQCPSDALRSTCEFTIPIVQQDNFAGYLFQNEAVQCIAVDGADRTWVGTRNGVWLLSPSGDKIISRFNASISPLLSDDVRSIAVSPEDGVVYFATTNGLCSYRGTATEAAESGFSVKIFPNPVPPGFNEMIAIRGLPENAIVSIVEADGRLVFRMRANGGQATWNGMDSRGQKPAKGVYLVLVSDENRQQNLAGKIVLLR